MNNKENRSYPVPQPLRDGAGATDIGPRNIARDIQNLDMLVPPSTDHGTIPNMTFSYSDTHMRLEHGGWSREVTTRELPVSKTIAGVNMRLTPGGVRELHWHKESEWAYMIWGGARITAVDENGRNFIADVKQGDLWFFPSAIPHSIQGLEEGCEFLLIFDNGNFSEGSTFTISDWFAHTPKEVLSANFGVSEDAFSDIPEGQKYIYQAEVPPPLALDEVTSPNGTVPNSFVYHLHDQKPQITSGGSVRIVDSTNFPISKTTAAALVEIKPGGIRELHWHPNNDEWQYYLTGKARMTVFAAEGDARTFNYQAGSVGYVPFANGHYIENIGDESVWFLEIFKSDKYEDISLNQWMALTPKELVASNLNVGSELLDTLHKKEYPVVKYPKNKREEG